MAMRIFIGAPLALLIAGSAGAAEVSNASWSRTPSWAQMQAVYPVTAKSNAGSVTLRCTVGPAGVPTDCLNGGERAEGEGFYEAALKLAALFVIAPTTLSTPAEGDVVEVPFRFTRPRSKDPRELRSPKWVNQMSVAEAQSLFPAAAPDGVKQGAAVVKCQITAEGRLKPCSVLADAPKGMGFGAAALATAERMAMNPWSEGFPVEGLTLSFRLAFSR